MVVCFRYFRVLVLSIACLCLATLNADPLDGSVDALWEFGLKGIASKKGAVLELEDCYFNVTGIFEGGGLCPFSTNGRLIAVASPGSVSDYEYDWGGGFQSDNEAPPFASDINLTVRDQVTGVEVNYAFIKESFLYGGVTANPACSQGGAGGIELDFVSACGNLDIRVSGPNGFIDENPTSRFVDAPPGEYSVLIRVTTGSGNGIDGLELGSTLLVITVGEAPVSIATSPGGASTRPTGAAQEELTCGEAEQIDLLDDEIQAFTNVTCSDGANVQYQWYEARGSANYEEATVVSSAAGGNQEFYTPASNEDGLLLLRQSRCADDPTDGGIWHVTSSVSLVDPITTDPLITNNNCFGESEGSVDLQPSGGQEPYQIDWNTPTGNSENLPAGDYNYTITDGGSCTLQGDFEITEPTELNVACQQISVVLHPKTPQTSR